MATVNVEISELADLCRLCGSKTSVLMGLHIFEREGDLREIYKKIKACLPIQVARVDKLPKMVCEECVYKLDALFEFRETSIKTEYLLHNMLKAVYTPVIPEPLAIPMDTFCPGTEHEGLHIQPAEVEIDLEGNSEPLEAIITLPLNHHSDMIKCEPEMGLDPERSCASSGAASQREACRSDGDSEGESAGTDSNDQPHLSEEVNKTIQIQVLRPLEGDGSTIDDDQAEVQRAQAYLIQSEQESESCSGQAWFYCNICGKPFHTSEEFQAHCEDHWEKCRECNMACDNKETLIAHMRDAHQFDSREDSLMLNESIKKSNITKKDVNAKQCPECGKEYKTKYKLAEHMRKHTGEKPFKCSMCEKAFRSKIGLAQHEAKHTGQYDYNCMTCGKGFQCKSYLIVHQRVHSDLKPYPCQTCGRNFKTKQSLLDHQNRHLGVKPYICDICGRGFITKGLCKSHQKVHSGLDNRQFPCSVCHKLFVSKSYLATHLRIHTGEKPFMCEVCGKGFLTRVDLRIHSTMHTGEKSFICEMCGKAFARRDALRCHKRSHTGERPYKCDICGQGFTQFSPMAIHKRLHTGERPYSCDICLKAFVSRSTMMSHRKKHTT